VTQTKQPPANSGRFRNTPAEVSGSVVTDPATLRNFTLEKHCGGLFELPAAA
jgi:hypothetical protein